MARGGPEVVVVGSANVDLVLPVQRIPRPGETVLAGVMTRGPGGKGANQAVASARAGAPHGNGRRARCGRRRCAPLMTARSVGWGMGRLSDRGLARSPVITILLQLGRQVLDGLPVCPSET